MVTRVGAYTLSEYGGLWFLTDEQDRPVSTILDMGDGTWRARTPEGSARTFEPHEIPADVEDVPEWLAEQITA